MVNSALNLDYEIFSTSYFRTSDFPNIENNRCIIKEESNTSTGSFEEQFNPQNLLEVSEDYLEEVNYIIPISGVRPEDFKGKFKRFKSKILGNKKTEHVEDKYNFYKKIKNKYLTPETFKLNDIDEANEIIKNNEDKQYIIKPISGSGGYDVNFLDNNRNFQINNDFLLQEYVEGTNLSSSVIGNGIDAKHIINSRLLTEKDFGKKTFLYIGNILPLTEKSILSDKHNNVDILNKELSQLSEDLIRYFKLIGSNGVDFIAKDDKIYIIEVNPRIQGTFECCEEILNKSLLEMHINSVFGELPEDIKINGYSYKKILYAHQKTKYRPINLDNIYDLPHNNSITEKNEPLLTIMDKDINFENLMKKIDYSNFKINSELEESN